MTPSQDLLTELVKKESVTPEDSGCQEMITNKLIPLGFEAEQLDFEDTKNIWLRRGQTKPLFTFLGHTDVVPPGPLNEWNSPPFEPTVRENKMYGRGTADMKGGIAAFITALERFIQNHPDHKGSIAIMLTSDEEGIATNGVVKVVEVLEKRQEKIDWCLVGEPSSDQKVADVIRVGRRGSLCAKLTVYGIQGHVAYPELACNPIHQFAKALELLTTEEWDQGNDYFPATSLQVSNINSGTGAENIIPGHMDLQFNLRFSTELNETTIKSRVAAILDQFDFKYEISWRLSGNPFLTQPGELISATHQAIQEVMGYEPKDDTGGGTSDGRFIAPTQAQVIELGPLNESIHKINEHIDLNDLENLSKIYEKILLNLLT